MTDKKLKARLESARRRIATLQQEIMCYRQAAGDEVSELDAAKTVRKALDELLGGYVEQEIMISLGLMHLPQVAEDDSEDTD